MGAKRPLRLVIIDFKILIVYLSSYSYHSHPNLLFSLLILILIYLFLLSLSSWFTCFSSHAYPYLLVSPLILILIYLFLISCLSLFTCFSFYTHPNLLVSALRHGTVKPWGFFLNLRCFKAWDSPRTLGLSQRPRVLTPWSLFLNLREPKTWDCGIFPEVRDSPGNWNYPKYPESQHNGVYLLIWDSLKPGTVGTGNVPEAQDSPWALQLSQRPGVLTPWGLFLNLKRPESLGQSQHFWIIPEALDSPRIPGESQDIGTVQKTQSPNTMGVISQSLETQKPNSSRTVGLS